MMLRSTILLSTAAVLVLSAGLVVGRLSSKLSDHVAVGKPAATQPTTDHGRGWFPETLNLSPEQKKSMDGVWADVKQQMDKDRERQKTLDHDRDAAIKALLTPDQSAQYDKIFTDYHAARAELEKDREKLMHAGNDRSRSLLTGDQQVKWDAMQKDMHDRDHRGPGGPGGRRNGPASQPATMQ